MKHYKIFAALFALLFLVMDATAQLRPSQFAEASGAGYVMTSVAGGRFKYLYIDTALTLDPTDQVGMVTVREALRNLYLSPRNLYTANGTIPNATSRSIDLGGTTSTLLVQRSDASSLAVFADGFTVLTSKDGDATLTINNNGATIADAGNQLEVTENAMVVQSTTGAALEYDANYAARYTSRSLVDKGWVDSIIATISYSAGNGHTLSGTTFSAGGSYSDHILFSSTASGINFTVRNTSGSKKGELIVGDDDFALEGTNSSNARGRISASSGVLFIGAGDGSSLYSLFTITGGTAAASSTTFTDGSTVKEGIQYAGDYSADYTSRSLTDKGYVDGAITTAISGVSSFYSSNGSLTSNRTVTGGGFSLAFSGVSGLTATTSSGNRTMLMDGTELRFTSSTLNLRAAAGASLAQPVLQLYEDPDNGSPNDFVGLRAASSVGTSRTWTLPDADATSASFWSFDASEIGSLVTFTSTSASEPFLTQMTGNTIFGGNQTAISGSMLFNWNSSTKQVTIGTNTQSPGTVFEGVRMVNHPSSGQMTNNSGLAIGGYGIRQVTADTISWGKIRFVVTDQTFGSEDTKIEFQTLTAGTLATVGTLSSLGNWNITSLNLAKTVTGGGTTGNQTINKATGTVNFAASATSLTVTNSLVTANSIILCTIGTNDATMTSCNCVAGSGSFVINANAAATAETRVNFIVTN